MEGGADKLLQTYRTIELNWRAVFRAVLTKSTEQTRQAKHLGEEAMTQYETMTQWRSLQHLQRKTSSGIEAHVISMEMGNEDLGEATGFEAALHQLNLAAFPTVEHP